MEALCTLTGRPFQYKRHPDGELIVYPPERDGGLQTRSAIVITPYTIDLAKEAISTAGRIAMGASRDAPPAGSLGKLVKQEKQSPQQLSYLVPILVDEGFCDAERRGKAFVVVRKEVS